MPPLTPPYTGGETNARSATMFQRSASPLGKGEPEEVQSKITKLPCFLPFKPLEYPR